MTTTVSVEDNAPSAISRRKLIAGLAALGAIQATESLARAQVVGPICYGPPDAPRHIVELDETTVFPLLASWLLLTTYDKFVPDVTDASGIASFASLVNLTPQCVKTILTVASNPHTKQAFKDVRGYYDQVVQTFAQHGPYQGGQCPGSAVHMNAVSTLTFAPSFKSK